MRAKPKIYIDGDACQVINKTEDLAKKYRVKCHIYCDTTRTIESDYSEIHTVDCGPDSVDFAILNACSKGDIIITADGGLASLALSRGCHVINPYGIELTNENVTALLASRYMRSRVCRSHGKKRTRTSSVMKACGPGPVFEKEPYTQILTRILRQITHKTP